MDNELYHYGIKKQRWGVRRFQNPDGTLTEAGKKRYRKELESYRADKKKLAEDRRAFERTKKNKEKVEKLLADKEALEAQKKELRSEKKAFKSEGTMKWGSRKKDKATDKATGEDLTAEQIDAKKQKVLDSRSAKNLYENANLFTTEELRTAYNRLTLENDIKNLSPETISRGKRALSNAAEYGEKISSILGSAAKAKKSLDSIRGKTNADGDKDKNKGQNQNNSGNKGGNQSGQGKQSNASSGKNKQPGGSDKGSATYQSQKEAEKAFSDAFERYSEKALSSMLKSARAYAQATSSVNADSVSTSTAIQLGKSYIAGLLEEPK